jgi:hypothetical protein
LIQRGSDRDAAARSRVRAERHGQGSARTPRLVATQLASITAVGASVLALTAGKAEAASIIVSGVLDDTIGFATSSIHNGNFTAALSFFDTFSMLGGPNFVVRAGSTNVTSAGVYTRAATLHRGTHSTEFGFIPARNLLFSAGASWGAAMSVTTFTAARRAFRTESRTSGPGSFTDKYFLFQFNYAGGLEYGWIEASLSVTASHSALASDGPNFTILQYAFDDTGAFIDAGQTVPTPEPSPVAGSGLAALILGAEGLRRWRAARQSA